MPFRNDCIDKHWKEADLVCRQCSDGFCFPVASRDEIERISVVMTEIISRTAGWHPLKRTLSAVVPTALKVLCADALEPLHPGVSSGIDKKAFTEWLYSDEPRPLRAPPMTVSLCVNNTVFLVGAHHLEEMLLTEVASPELPTPHEGATEANGPKALREIGFSIHRNQRGNSVLCSYKKPASA